MIAATDGKDDKSVETDGAVVLGALGVKPLTLVVVRVVRRFSRATSSTTTAATTSTTSSASTLLLLLRASWLIIFTHFFLFVDFDVKFKRKQIFTAIEIWNVSKVYHTSWSIYFSRILFFCLSQLSNDNDSPDLKWKDSRLMLRIHKSQLNSGLVKALD